MCAHDLQGNLLKEIQTNAVVWEEPLNQWELNAKKQTRQQQAKPRLKINCDDARAVRESKADERASS